MKRLLRTKSKSGEMSHIASGRPRRLFWSVAGELAAAQGFERSPNRSAGDMHARLHAVC
jgi:hypothetical protein